MTEYEALLRAIITAPGDDLPRLVLADWLEEHGQSERAELIRTQCDQLYSVPCGQVSYPLDGMPDLGVSCMAFHLPQNEVDPTACPQCKVRHRVAQILQSLDQGTTRNVTYPFTGNGWTAYTVMQYERGFAREVRAPLAVLVGGECNNGCEGTGRWVSDYFSTRPCPYCSGTGRTPGILPRLVREQPVERVVVTDREPWQVAAGEGRWGGWSNSPEDAIFPGSRHILPPDVFAMLPELSPQHRRFRHRRWFDTAADARTALSAALLAWAKSQHQTEVPA